MKLVVLDAYAANPHELSSNPFHEFGEVVIYDKTSKTQTISRIADADMVFTNKTSIRKEVFDACPNIKYIGLFSTGYNVVDIEEAKARGIVVANVPEYSTNAVAQQTIAFMLEFYNRISKYNDEVKTGAWEECANNCFYNGGIHEMCGKTLGLIGFGNIAKKVAEIAKSFDMNILVYSRTIYPEFESEHLKFVSFENMLSQSDIISIHCPLFTETKGLINKNAISLMKESAILINTARGAIIVEEDVANALNDNKISGYGADVASYEPIKQDNPLLKAKNCVLTPHIAWGATETRSRLLEIMLSNIRAYLAGTPQNNVAK